MKGILWSLVLMVMCDVGSVHAQPSVLMNPLLVDSVLVEKKVEIIWGSTGAASQELRAALGQYIDSLYRLRFIQQPYHQQLIQKSAIRLVDSSAATVRLYIDALLATIHDLQQGYKIKPWVSYDAVSARFRKQDDSCMVAWVRAVHTKSDLDNLLGRMEPRTAQYKQLRAAYLAQFKRIGRQVAVSKVDTLARLLLAMNLIRWMQHVGGDRYLLVNIADATLQYVEHEVPVLTMRTIVGKPSTPSPQFAAWCRQLILYPYWYVPYSIATTEYLSRIKRNPSWIDDKNMQLLDARGKVVDHHRLRWSTFSAGYFPYTLRQSTGCDNALGVLKFDIETPYGVYLHDTNNKAAFLRSSRWLSHGCIRLEDPLPLGARLLGTGLDTAYLASCYREQKPVYRTLSQPIPVFAIYNPVTIARDGSLLFSKDPYGLFLDK